jgi:hypothetical protein
VDGRDSRWNIPWPKQGPLNLQVTGNMPDFARGGILNEKTFFSPFSNKAEIERRRNFENLLAVYLWRHNRLLQCIVDYTG